jgi:hypothetical protein
VVPTVTYMRADGAREMLAVGGANAWQTLPGTTAVKDEPTEMLAAAEVEGDELGEEEIQDAFVADMDWKANAAAPGEWTRFDATGAQLGNG